MQNKKLDQLVDQMENYLECWKQFNVFMSMARVKKFAPEDDIHFLVGNAPSLRYLSEMSEGALRNLENQWHKVYIGWHSILGQLKVRQRQEEATSGFSVFGRKKAA